MDTYWEAFIPFSNTTTDNSYLPSADKSVWILGKEHSSLNDRDEIVDDIRSRLWFTYRRGFTPIGDENGPTTDTGWGCMHRCGQMLIGQALMELHLGRDWRWNPDRLDQPYLRILKMFEDKPSATYSIHSIATKFASDDNKAINSWLGPNTIAHILKKLSADDRWNNLFVHVTTEDGIIVQEIRNLCRQSVSCHYHKSSFDGLTPPPSPASLHSDAVRKHSDRPVIVSNPISVELDDDFVEIILPPVYNMPDQMSASLFETRTTSDDADFPSILTPSSTRSSGLIITAINANATWRPLLLIIPLRLGLHEFNMRYASAFQSLFKLRQCVGVIGGRPNHALWLIGCVAEAEEEVICLDPHTTQPAAILGEPAPGSSGRCSGSMTDASLDGSFHCTAPVCLPLRRLDPSLAVGFVCPTEADFDELCIHLITESISPILFEVHETRPHNLPPLAFTSLRVPEEWSDLYASASSPSPTSNTSNRVVDGDFELM